MSKQKKEVVGTVMPGQEYISVRGARQHNLKNINVDIPIGKLTVITGLSGSGKSSLAFDTLYAEGQRRYVESLSVYARQFLGVMSKPDVDSIKGLSPAIAIEQKKLSHNPRSTVGTVTEIYDYLRLLFARIGVPHCPHCNKKIQRQDAQSIAKQIIREYDGARVQILAPLVRGRKGTYEYLFTDLKKQGFGRVRADGVMYNLGTETIVLKKTLSHTVEVVIDRVEVSASDKTRLQEGVEKALSLGEGLVYLLVERKEDTYDLEAKKWQEKRFSQNLACIDCGVSMDGLEPRMFSFNSPMGACQECHGIGAIQEFDERLIIPNHKISLMDAAVAPWRMPGLHFRWHTLETLADHYSFDAWMRIQDVPRYIINIILWGDKQTGNANADSRVDHKADMYELFEGVIPQLKRLYHTTKSDDLRTEIAKFMTTITCPNCHGDRLRPEYLAVRINEKSIISVTKQSIQEAMDFFTEIKPTPAEAKVADPIIKEIKARLSFLLNVGLDYLTLARTASTLSGGEGQRINLATQIGSELRGVLYILDEPSIGLHQRDNTKLIETLQHLRDIGNTVIVVEHDEDTMRAADHIIDIGPGAGVHGGAVVGEGTADQLKKDKESMTGKYLSGKERIEIPKVRRTPRGFITIEGARENNLKNIDAKIPLSVFCCVTGVSGSGKSTLINETLSLALNKHFNGSLEEPGEHDKIDGLSYLDKVITIDQSPIGRTPRSNPATYTGVFTYIRELFAQTKESKMRGYSVGRFSFNVNEGRCGNCEGDGLIKIEMYFLSDVYVECEVCKGKRYDDETLSILYKNKSIADVLGMTVEEAMWFFAAIPKIKSKMQAMYDVGLGYIQLGQSATTLSGGEAQRIKLATELAKRDTGRTLYLLDEPTTGLHFDDVKRLLGVLDRLAEKGNSVLVIEHNLDVIKTADWIIDLGPEGGYRGGEIVAAGTPEQVAKVAKSWTGQYLAPLLKKK